MVAKAFFVLLHETMGEGEFRRLLRRRFSNCGNLGMQIDSELVLPPRGKPLSALLTVAISQQFCFAVSEAIL